MKEVWKNIKGYLRQYQVSNLGNVRSLDRYCSTGFKPGIVRKQQISNSGYSFVTLWKNGKRKNKFVHRLVAETFIPNKNNKKETNHIDGNKLNNTVSNLEWCTGSENMLHAYNLGLLSHYTGENSYRTKLTDEQVYQIKWIQKYENPPMKFYRELAKELGVSNGVIFKIRHNINWKHIEV